MTMKTHPAHPDLECRSLSPTITMTSLPLAARRLRRRFGVTTWRKRRGGSEAVEREGGRRVSGFDKGHPGLSLIGPLKRKRERERDTATDFPYQYL